MDSLADIVTLAEAVADSLNAGEFVLEFEAKRSYAPRVSRSGAELRVFVMPTADDAELISREIASQHDYKIQVGIISPVTVSDDETSVEEMDRLLLLVQQIKDHVRDADDIIPETSVAVHRIEHQPIFDNQSLRENNEFRSAPVFVFRCSRTQD